MTPTRFSLDSETNIGLFKSDPFQSDFTGVYPLIFSCVFRFGPDSEHPSSSQLHEIRHQAHVEDRDGLVVFPQLATNGVMMSDRRNREA